MKRKIIFSVIAAALLITISTWAEARVTHIAITRIESPTFEGVSFGETGRYEKIVGVFYGELDPTNPKNAVIVDLDKAPKVNGKVQYSADFYILKPVDMKRGNDILLYEFGNRGGKGLLRNYNDSTGSRDPTTAQDAGTGFLMRRGYTLAWCGILADVLPVDNRLTIQVPVARNLDGSVIEETIWDECMTFVDAPSCSFPYPVPTLKKSKATLLVREFRSDDPVEIPRKQWNFINANTIELVDKVFTNSLIYQFIHKAENPPVMGIGYASARDWVSFLRYQTEDDLGNPNPLTAGINFALSYGASQTGRFEGEFVYLGFNEDESVSGRLVFEGMERVAAATRPFINFRFAQPTRRADFQHWELFYPNPTFPFAYEDQYDPITEKTDGILHRCNLSDTCPKIMHQGSSNQYWEFKESLALTDPLGTRDAVLPENVRFYFFTGGGESAYRKSVPDGFCVSTSAVVDYRPLTRSLLVALTDWVNAGVNPPVSRHPRIDDGTLVSADAVDWPSIPGVPFAGPVVNRNQVYDYGPDFDQGIISQVLPIVTEDEYKVLVPQVDEDGNDLGGIRLPTISVPIATQTGWGTFKNSPAQGELCIEDGSYIPFPATEAERLATDDPRLSIEERYPDHGTYVSKVTHAVNELVKERFLLQEDAQILLDEAVKSDIGK